MPEVGGQAVLGRQFNGAIPWLTERHGYDPTLDKRGVEEMRQIFLNLKAEGTTILLASHNMEDIRCLCDKVYEMDAGVLTPIDGVS